MPRMTMIEAIRSAMDVCMGRDETVVVFGEDIGYFGGVFRCTQGLQQKYGRARCSTRRSVSSASLARRSAWPATASSPASKSSSPITSPRL